MNNLFSKSTVIFISMLIILALCAAFPTPAVIGLLTLISSILIIYQTIIILKDEGKA